MRIFGGQRSFFVGRSWNASVSRTYDVGTPGWWVLATLFYLAWVGFLTLFIVLLTDLSFPASLGLGVVAGAVMAAYGYVRSFRR
ncbi:MAG TPA: hypothetical protein VJ872_10830 [Nocardioides sp.]|nr:hypothetical protein [Nocardioides sp.]